MDGWMFAKPDQSTNQSINKVYFNGFVSYNQGGFLVGLAGGSQGNVNSAVVPTAISPANYNVYAMLGVWKDCNKDGYIGLADQGLWEYRAELLLGETSVCPVQPVPSPLPVDWMPVHNDGQWVHEFLSVGWSPATAKGDINHLDVNDNGARVWFDAGSPESKAASGSSCWVNPPTGSLHSTGGVLFWADCLDRYGVTDAINTVTAASPLLAPLSFSDHPRDQYNSASRLNQPNPWGDEQDASNVRAWDCSQPQTKVATPAQPTPTGGQVNSQQVNVSQPRIPPTVSTTGSPSGTTNDTLSGFDQCYRRTDRLGNGNAGTVATAPYFLEAPVTQGASKTAAGGTLFGIALTHRPATCALDAVDSYTVALFLGSRCTVTLNAPAPVGPVPVSTDLGQNPLGSGTPPGLGQKISTMDGVWWDYVGHTRPGFLNRGNLTYYGFVSPAAVTKYGLTLPKGSATGTYGQEACGIATSGILNGWDCDATHWYKDAKGNDISERSPYLGQEPGNTGPCTPRADILGGSDTGPGARGCVLISPVPGTQYNLRDVDCYDATVEQARGSGIYPIAPAPDPAPRIDACGPPPAS